MVDHQDNDDVVFIKVSRDVSRKRTGQSRMGDMTVETHVVHESNDVSIRKRIRAIRLDHLAMVSLAEALEIKVRGLISKALDASWKGDFVNAFNHAYDGVREAEKGLAGISADSDGREPTVRLP